MLAIVDLPRTAMSAVWISPPPKTGLRWLFRGKTVSKVPVVSGILKTAFESQPGGIRRVGEHRIFAWVLEDGHAKSILPSPSQTLARKI